MNYHMIRTDDMLNGDGLRVVLFVSGCDHHCEECHNPETWHCDSGKPFNTDALITICKELENNYISGITLSGGDPFHPSNVETIFSIIDLIKHAYPHKSIWLYTGYAWEELRHFSKPIYDYILSSIDVLVDGKYQKALSDVNYPWAGSTNQRVIDVQKSLQSNTVVLYKSF